MHYTDKALYNNDIEAYYLQERNDTVKDYAKYREENGRVTSGFMFYTYTLYAVPGPNVPLHWHEEVEIMFPKTDGVLILDGKKIDFHEDDILFVNSRQLHSTYHINAGWSYHIVVHPELFCTRNILNDKNRKFRFPEKLDSDDVSYRQILEDIIQIPTPISDANKLFIMSKLFELLFYLTDNGYSFIENEPELTTQTGYIKSALEYIHQNLSHKIPVQSIADEVGISKEYLMRLFKLYTGDTVNSYIQAHRLEAAKNDLAAGYSLTDIIYKYSYSDVAYFCRLFKKQYGISPGKFKETPDPISQSHNMKN